MCRAQVYLGLLLIHSTNVDLAPAGLCTGAVIMSKIDLAFPHGAHHPAGEEVR